MSQQVQVGFGWVDSLVTANGHRWFGVPTMALEFMTTVGLHIAAATSMMPPLPAPIAVSLHQLSCDKTFNEASVPNKVLKSCSPLLLVMLCLTTPLFSSNLIVELTQVCLSLNRRSVPLLKF